MLGRLRERLAPFYTGAADIAALVLFPFPKRTNETLVFYTVALALGLWWWTENWLWIPGVIFCMAMAWMIDRWFLFGE